MVTAYDLSAKRHDHSCHHPPTHKIPLDEIKANPKALHNTQYKKQQMQKCSMVKDHLNVIIVGALKIWATIIFLIAFIKVL